MNERRWRFPGKRRVDPNIDPVQGEFFTPEGLVDGLVRESIQNSLDAGRGKSVVRVQFSLYEDAKSLLPEKYSKYLTGLWEHLENLDAEFPDQDEPMSFLVVEDFGTCGLNGDPAQSVDVEAAKEKNNFYYFWRNIGRSEKSDTDRGRWGLGKTVFPAASRINSFFGLTVREDGRRLLMGQSVVKMHQVGDVFFTAYGGFGMFEADDFVMPLEGQNIIREFSADFRLQRTAEPGLSVVVPFFRGDEIDIQDIIRAVIVHYFFPILSGDLVVQFTDGSITETADASKLDSLAEKYWTDGSADDMRKLFDLARWAVTDPDRIEMKRPGEHAPFWGDHLLDEAALVESRRRYDAGEQLAFRIPLPIKPKATHSTVMSHFDMYLQRDDSAPKGQRQYLRRGITIPNKNVMRAAGARGLIVINDPLLSTVLGDAEGPAHTDWNERSPKVKDKYVYAPAIVRFVKTSFDEAVALLSRPPEGVEEDLLRDLFSIEVPQEEEAETTEVRKRRRGPTQPIEIKIENPTPPSFSLVRSSGGFVIHRVQAAGAVGRTIRVMAAYNVSSGNPMKRYNPFDFEFGKDPIVVETRGCTTSLLRENRAEFDVTDDDFEIRVKGFDVHRDLRVIATSAARTE